VFSIILESPQHHVYVGTRDCIEHSFGSKQHLQEELDRCGVSLTIGPQARDTLQQQVQGIDAQ
jgi:hypothetical protein